MDIKSLPLPMRWFLVAAMLLSIAGVGCLFHAHSFPVYSDPDAPSRLSMELESRPEETRSREWYTQMRAFETPHKRFADLGRGLCAAGAGLLAAVAFWSLYPRLPFLRKTWVIFVLWSALWMVRIPLSMWYYEVRADRHEFPSWGDSILIPIYSESILWLMGAAVSSLILGLLFIRHPLPSDIRWGRPVSVYGWLRTGFIGIWLGSLASVIAPAIVDGDEGMVFSCTAAVAILCTLLSAPELESRPNPRLLEKKPLVPVSGPLP